MSQTTAQKIVIPSDTQAARAIQMRIVRLLQQRQFSEADVLGVRLALEEALMNAIKHGNKMDPAKTVRVEYVVTPEQVSIEVEDQGTGFCPGQVPDPTLPENLERPGGRGVFLIQRFMSSVEYNARGNHVRMIKVRTTVAPVPAPLPAPAPAVRNYPK